MSISRENGNKITYSDLDNFTIEQLITIAKQTLNMTIDILSLSKEDIINQIKKKIRKINKQIDEESDLRSYVFTNDNTITRLNCSYSYITSIPNHFTQLTYLNCSNTKITKIPKEFTQLDELNCSNTKITKITKEFTQITYLFCSNTKITKIPKELTRLLHLKCSNTQITEIPKEFTQLRILDCSNTEITEIPRSLNLINFYCNNCPNLAIVPDHHLRQKFVNEQNFVRVPLRTQKLFKQAKKDYNTDVKDRLEIKFYTPPYGKGFLELVKKYENINGSGKQKKANL